MIRFFITLLSLAAIGAISGCATPLTEKGRAITVVNSLSAELASDCTRIGAVTGYAKAGWGNDVGYDQAFNDARNKAAEYPTADTLAISNSRHRFSGGEVTGIVFDCSKQRVQLIQQVSPPPPATGQSPDNVFELAKRCQSKGGVWINNQCVIDIE